MPINWNRKKYTQEQLRVVVKESVSWRETARKLGMNPDAGGIYYGLKAAVADLGLDTSHFTGMGWNKGDTFGLVTRITIPLEEILIENSTYLNTTNLKNRLIKQGLLEKKCGAPFCNLFQKILHPFTGEEVDLKLSLDHINGNRYDNRIENLRLLCYVCHGYTLTYCGSNKKQYASSTNLQIVDSEKAIFLSVNSNHCNCGREISKNAITCRFCRTRKTKIDWLPEKELIAELKASNYLVLSKKIGVSDNAIRKHVKSLGYDPKSLIKA